MNRGRSTHIPQISFYIQWMVWYTTNFHDSNEISHISSHTQGDQIGRNLAMLGLPFKGPGKFGERIWFVVGTYRVQKKIMQMFGTLKLSFLWTHWQLFGLLFPKFGWIYFLSSGHLGHTVSCFNTFQFSPAHKSLETQDLNIFMTYD